MFSKKWWTDKTIVIAYVSVGFGVLVGDIVTAKFLPAQEASFIKIQTSSACGSVKSSLEWFNLAVAIQNQRHRLDKEETLFIANVINRLTVTEDVMPTPDHAQWLCNLKGKLGL